MDALLDARIVGALGLMVLLTLAPGPDTALVTTAALARGRGAALRTSLGICCGVVAWGVLAGLGVAAVLAASAEAFTVVRLIGAAYLVVLGVRALIDAWRGAGELGAADGDERRAARNATLQPFRQGLLTNLLNPKVGIFYTTLVPQLVDPGDPIALVSIAMGLAHATIGLAWLTALAMLVDRAGDVLRRPRVRRLLAGATGAVLIAFGVRVALEPE